MAEQQPSNLPDQIQQRFDALQDQIDAIIQAASAILKTELPAPISVSITNSSPLPSPTTAERAQAVSFVTRYEQLHPDPCEIRTANFDGLYYISNFSFLKHVLNEYRPLIQNKTDNVYYQRVHRFCYEMLDRDDDGKGNMIRVSDGEHNDIKPTFAKWLCERNKAISFVLKPTDFGYLYNGILQHSNPKYTQQFLDDYTSGKLQYILVKHVYILHFIRDMLKPYYILMSAFSRPKLGPL